MAAATPHIKENGSSVEAGSTGTSQAQSVPSRRKDYRYPASLLKTAVSQEITSKNLESSLSHVVSCIRNAAFVAVDLEFSGIGDGLNNADVQERYEATIRHSREYGILALGIACFTSAPTDTDGPETPYKVQLFNILMRREGAYTVKSKSLTFLALNGFDLQAQALHGVSYTPGTLEKQSTSNTCLRKIFAALRTRPLVMHNAWIDLVMLYHALHGDLPPTLDTFAADLAYMFPCGVFDTKLVAECREADNKSSLNYLFRKAEREQDSARAFGQPHFTSTIVVPLSGKRAENYGSNAASPPKIRELCPHFRKKGVCRRDRTCEYSHDIDSLLDLHFQRVGGEYQQSRAEVPVAAPAMSEERDQEHPSSKRRRLDDGSKAECEGEIDLVDSGDERKESTVSRKRTISDVSSVSPAADARPAPHETTRSASPSPALAAHSADADALMTGFVFAHHLHKGWATLRPSPSIEPSNGTTSGSPPADGSHACAGGSSSGDDDSTGYFNKVYLAGKAYPLRLFKSAYGEYSPAVSREREIAEAKALRKCKVPSET